MRMYKFAVAGTGYVGLSMAVLLSQRHKVTAVDILPEKITAINNRESPIKDNEIESNLKNKYLDLIATQDAASAYRDGDYIMICTPTNYDPAKNFFDTTSIENVINIVQECKSNAVIVIKSTVPVGYTQALTEKYQSLKFIFSQNF